jgi:hypothetical protein
MRIRGMRQLKKNRCKAIIHIVLMQQNRMNKEVTTDRKMKVTEITTAITEKVISKDVTTTDISAEKADTTEITVRAVTGKTDRVVITEITGRAVIIKTDVPEVLKITMHQAEADRNNVVRNRIKDHTSSRGLCW